MRQAAQAQCVRVRDLCIVRIGVREARDNPMAVQRLQKTVRPVQLYREGPAADTVRAAQNLLIFLGLRVAEPCGILRAGLRSGKIRPLQMQAMDMRTTLALELNAVEHFHKLQQLFAAAGHRRRQNCGCAVQHMAPAGAVNRFLRFHKVKAARSVIMDINKAGRQVVAFAVDGTVGGKRGVVIEHNACDGSVFYQNAAWANLIGKNELRVIIAGRHVTRPSFTGSGRGRGSGR